MQWHNVCNKQKREWEEQSLNHSEDDAPDVKPAALHRVSATRTLPENIAWGATDGQNHCVNVGRMCILLRF